MHAFSHSLAHRAPPATRRVRWQPYGSSSVSSVSSVSSRSSTTTYLNTPSSVSSSSPPTTPCEIERPKHALPPVTQSPRDVNKNKYAIGLVDQAVKSLCEIWLPQDIPTVFLTSSRATVGSSPDVMSAKQTTLPQRLSRRNTQLPSPVSPSSTKSPISPPSRSSTSVQKLEDFVSTTSRSNLVPIKSFVHEVLRRSRTSGSVLQTALCYLEAIRSQVPELVRLEKSGQGVKGEPELGSRIIVESGSQAEVDLGMSLDDILNPDKFTNVTQSGIEDVMATVRISDADEFMGSFQSVSQDGSLTQTISKKPQSTLPALPPLPSPLLCPRRAFLASLILASKFTQDRCYSNRAWAKLSGLPPREIGRCERALGDALEWRLWVGKVPAAPQPSPSQSAVNRPVARCRSDGALQEPAPKAPVQQWVSSQTYHNASQSSSSSSSNWMNSSHIGLRRCATLPADSLVSDIVGPRESDYPIPSDLEMSSISTDCATDASYPPWLPSVDVPRYNDALSQSPSPPTPGLSHSPSSTESSSGDRTIQMSGFIDEIVTPFGGSGYCGSTGGSGVWPWDAASEDFSHSTIKSMVTSVSLEDATKSRLGPITVVGGVSELPYTSALGREWAATLGSSPSIDMHIEHSYA